MRITGAIINGISGSGAGQRAGQRRGFGSVQASGGERTAESLQGRRHAAATLVSLTLLLCAAIASGQVPNDACTTPTVVSGLPFADVVDTTTATGDPGDPAQSCSSASTNSHSVWYALTAASDATLTIDTFGSSYDTVLSVYTGTCGNLTEVACSDDEFTGSRVIVPVTSGESLLILVTQFGAGPGGGALTFRVDVGAAPPNDECLTATEALALPFSELVDTAFATTASSDPIQSCTNLRSSNSVWYGFTASSARSIRATAVSSDYDNVLTAYTGSCGTLDETETACDGAGTTSQVTVPISAGESVLFEVTALGASIGGILDFSLASVSPPPNDACSNPTPIPIPQLGARSTDATDTTDASSEAGDPIQSCTNLQSSQSVWYSLTAPPGGGTLTADTFGSAYDTVLSVYAGSCGSLTEIACNDDWGGKQSRVLRPLAGGQAILIEVTDFGAPQGGTLVFSADVDTCGNGLLNEDLGEACEPSDGVCCAPTCDFEPSGTECRAGEACDLAEFCTGIGVQCPTDLFAPAGTVCRNAIGGCDLTESCVGGDPACPPDLVLGAGEPCDDGDVCTPVDECDGAGSCIGMGTRCGDDVTDAICGEECDDGMETVGCDLDCSIAFCGDETINTARLEQCDDGPNNSDTTPDACRSNCTTPVCGDGVIDPGFGETCEVGDPPGAVCDSNCQQPLCGNGDPTDPGEECDDGAANGVSGCCSVQCRCLPLDRPEGVPCLPDTGTDDDADGFSDADEDFSSSDRCDPASFPAQFCRQMDDPWEFTTTVCLTNARCGEGENCELKATFNGVRPQGSRLPTRAREGLLMYLAPNARRTELPPGSSGGKVDFTVVFAPNVDPSSFRVLRKFHRHGRTEEITAQLPRAVPGTARAMTLDLGPKERTTFIFEIRGLLGAGGRKRLDRDRFLFVHP